MYRTLTPNGSLNKGDMSKKVNTVCCKLRECLQDKDLVTYANAIMTSYVCQQPQDLESALRVITAVKRMSTGAYRSRLSFDFRYNSSGSEERRGRHTLHHLPSRCKPALRCSTGNVRLRACSGHCSG